MLHAVMATVGFELSRSFSLQRLRVAAVLGLFPPTLLYLIIVSGAPVMGPLPVVILLWLVMLLALMLWATPAISAELESRGWLFTTTRPQGRWAILLGKYITAIVAAGTVVTFSAMLSVGVLVIHAVPLVEGVRDLRVLGLIWLATVTYGAVFLLLGTIFPRRAMAVAAGYIVVSEVMLATAPAVVNKLTIRFYLQGLALEWLDPLVHPEFDRAQFYAVFGQLPTGVLVGVLLLMSFLFLGIAMWLVKHREFLTTAEV